MSYDWMVMCVIKEKKISFNDYEMYFICMCLIYWIQDYSQHVSQLLISMHVMKSHLFIYLRSTLCCSSFPKYLLSYTKCRVYKI